MSKLAAAQIIITICLLGLVSQSFQLIVDPDGKYNFEFELSEDKESVTFELTVQTLGFVGFAVSPDGRMNGSDIVGAEIRENGANVELKDFYAVDHRPSEDGENNLTLLDFSQNGTTTYVKFSRNVEAGDPIQDLPIIKDGNTIFLWAYGADVMADLAYHGGARGAFEINVFGESM